MIRAYAESYLDSAMNNLGEAFDYAANACKFSPDDFLLLFIATGYADSFEKGDPKTISGLSGTELVMEVIRKSGKNFSFPKPQTEYDFSPEYWSGWILAYYQWKTGRTFRNIHGNLSMTEIIKLYPTLHEASEDKFIDTVNKIIKRKSAASSLQMQRKRCGYSQKDLALLSGVNIRTLQQYEIRAKDIGKASANTLISLANVLGCRTEDLIEYPTLEND